MRISVFSGTSDGRELCGYLADMGHSVTAYVATEYGASLMDGIAVRAGRLDAAAMAEKLAGCDAVIDATHPYAVEVSKNIKSACGVLDIKYYRLIRNETEHGGCISVPDAAAACEYLKNTCGRIFVSTGSKELAEFEAVGNRVKARVLDIAAVREQCRSVAIAEIMYKMPPFSYEDNLTDFKGCKYLVTKDSGTAGGTEQKLDAANALGMTVVMLQRPREEGYSLSELKNIFTNRGYL